MPTYSEQKFRQHIIKLLGEPLYIKKMPDYKSIGSPVMRGMPDYLVIKFGITYWFEVKYSTSKKTFNLNSINEYQFIELNQMHENGATIIIAILLNKTFYLVEYGLLKSVKFIEHKSSIDVNKLIHFQKLTELILHG